MVWSPKADVFGVEPDGRKISINNRAIGLQDNNMVHCHYMYMFYPSNIKMASSMFSANGEGRSSSVDST